MELHSYAKRRTLKKWTIEQKRNLVEARISHDAWFTNKPSSLVPWKNILIAANLTDFNVFFVRKQWSNMLARYKQYKQTRLGSNIASKAIDAELIKRINQEWEFFEPIHKFMTHKTTNLHSYALTHRTDNNNGEKQKTGEGQEETSTVKEQELHRQTNKSPTNLLLNETITINLPKDCVKENIPNNTTIVIQSNNNSQDDGIHLFSSDTYEDFPVIAETTRIIKKAAKKRRLGDDEEDENKNFVRNTDHDFYSKRSSLGRTVNELNCTEDDALLEQQSNYFADASEESRGSLNMVVDLLQTTNPTNDSSLLYVEASNDTKNQNVEIKVECLDIKQEINDQEFLNDMPSTSTQNNVTQNLITPQTSSKPRLSERDKYYRHKRRFNRRLEKRFDALLKVMGEIVKAEYPRVDITPMMSTVTSLASSMGKVLSSDSEDDD